MITPQKRMASLHIDPHTWALMQSALYLLPRRVGFKVLRKALMAWGGFVKKRAQELAPDETGLLKKSLKVEAVIPDASFNVKHHGKPAYVMVGPSRKVVGYTVGGKLTTQRRAMKIAAAFGTYQRRRPSRYAHLVERGTKPHDIKVGGRIIRHPGSKAHPFIGPAQAAGATTGMALLRTKLESGIMQEAAALASRN